MSAPSATSGHGATACWGSLFFPGLNVLICFFSLFEFKVNPPDSMFFCFCSFAQHSLSSTGLSEGARVTSVHDALVSSGCCNEYHRLGGLNRQPLMSNSSGG